MRGSTEAVLAAFFSGTHLTTQGGPTYSEVLRIGRRALDGAPVLLTKSRRLRGRDSWDTTVCVLFPEACFATPRGSLSAVTQHKLDRIAAAWRNAGVRDALGRNPRQYRRAVPQDALVSRPYSMLMIIYAE